MPMLVGITFYQHLPQTTSGSSVSSAMADKPYAGVIQDAKFKRREALADLAKAAVKK
jgi:hypothetical protein